MDDHKRLFFALCPDAFIRAELQKAQQQYESAEARPVIQENLHMTLLFLGMVPNNLVPKLNALAQTIQLDPFSLHIDHIDVWPRQRLMWAGCHQVPKKLQQLEHALRKGAQRCGIKIENRPYHPHITLARKVKTGTKMELSASLEWQVNAFSLVESVTEPSGVVYSEIASWKLA